MNSTRTTWTAPELHEQHQTHGGVFRLLHRAAKVLAAPACPSAQLCSETVRSHIPAVPVLWWAEQPELVRGKPLDPTEPAKIKAQWAPERTGENRVLEPNLEREDGLDTFSQFYAPIFLPPPSQLLMQCLLSEERSGMLTRSSLSQLGAEICCLMSTNSSAFRPTFKFRFCLNKSNASISPKNISHRINSPAQWVWQRPGSSHCPWGLTHRCPWGGTRPAPAGTRWRHSGEWQGSPLPGLSKTRNKHTLHASGAHQQLKMLQKSILGMGKCVVASQHNPDRLLAQPSLQAQPG